MRWLNPLQKVGLGNVYVADGGNNSRVQKFDSNGMFITKWGSSGTADGRFHNPWGVTVDSKTGNVYVADTGNDRVQKFDSNGTFITKWSYHPPTASGETNSPVYAVTVDPKTGNVYVAGGNGVSFDGSRNSPVQVFSPSS